MTMSSQEIGTALKYISSSSEKIIYNGLVSVRTKLIKNKYAAKQLRIKGIISKLLAIIYKQDLSLKHNKLADIALSILGNFCMEEEAREDVLKVGYGVICIADCVIESPCSSIKERAARTIANLAQSPLSIPRILQTEVLPELVQLLIDAKTKESQLIYCRTLRLIGSNNIGKEKVLNENGVFAIAKLMKSEEEEVVKSSLRTVADLSVSGCSFKFGCQIFRSGAVNVMTDHVMNSDNTVSHNALSALIRLAEFEYIRPVIGSAGGILLFINLLSDERQHVDHVKVMNVLCLCGKESVNRVKIRENGALEILLAALDREKFTKLHDRIISSFLSYLYDELSLNLLLDNKLIDLLLFHLQRCTGFSSTIVTVSFDEKLAPIKQICDMDMKPDFILARPKQVAKRFKGKASKNRLENKNSEITSSTSPVTSKTVMATLNQVTGHLERESSDDQFNSSITVDIPTTKPDRIYSMDSPTYQNHSWDMSPLSEGITCKKYFSPCASTSQSPPQSRSPSQSQSPTQSQYSPLSHDSYYSPSVSSPSYSPPGSPDNIPYSTVWSQPYNADSGDESSPFSTGASAASKWTFSSSEDEENPNDESSDNADAMDKRTEVCPKTYSSEEVFKVPVSEIEETMIQSDQSDEMSTSNDAFSSLSLNEKKTANDETPGESHSTKCRKHKRTATSENSDPAVQAKKLKTSNKREPTSKITESNILILLSRVSVKNDPSQYLVTHAVLSCMLDYIRDVQGAQSRCVRTLSRILRDPLCLDRLMSIGAPVLIYQKLVLNVNGVDDSDVRSLLSKSKIRLSIDSNSSWTSPFSSPRQSGSDFSPDPTGKPWNFPTDPSSPSSPSTGTDFSVASPHFKKEEKEEPPLNIQQTGLELLRDLSFTAESPFGQGSITHILLRRTKAERLSCCLSLQYLCWSSSMQDHFLVKHFTMHSLLELIKTKYNHPMLPHIVSGLNFQARICSMKRKLTEEKPVKFPALVATVECSAKCPYWNCDHDVFFQVNGDQQLGGNREILVKQSPVFAAMLEGHYCESNQSEIVIQDTPHNAFLFILHYLHGCDLNCACLVNYYENTESLDFWESALSLCDRYLCQSLTEFLIWSLACKYLTFELYFRIFMYSAFHGFSSLTNECVRMLFSAEKPLVLKVGIFRNILQNKGSEFLSAAVKSVFSEIIGKNFR